LDWQNTFHKAVSRSGLKVAFSHGYNPVMKISMGIALPLFCESVTELVDIEFLENYEPENIVKTLQKVLPKDSKVLSVYRIDKSDLAIDHEVAWAEYKIKILNQTVEKFQKLVYNTEKVLSQDKILVERKNKKGLVKTTDIKKSIGAYSFKENCLFIVLKAGQDNNIPSLRADVLMDIIAPEYVFNITRTRFLTESLHEI
jgi:radical SAM-linked protein